MSTTTTRDRGDRYGPIEWAQQVVKECWRKAALQGFTSSWGKFNVTLDCVSGRITYSRPDTAERSIVFARWRQYAPQSWFFELIRVCIQNSILIGSAVFFRVATVIVSNTQTHRRLLSQKTFPDIFTCSNYQAWSDFHNFRQKHHWKIGQSKDDLLFLLT